jgi:Vault protein inter-alpha-trypsin domain
MLLVDPLAAFFRAELEGCAPLVLDSTHVDVTLLPPLAQIVVVRHFTNSSDQLIEAVLTLPPLARHEVVFRLAVYIGGVHYDAIPQPAKRARRAHDAAIADGRRAIHYELLKHDIQMISIAGIRPGDTVEVQIWSIKPLGRLEENLARLFIPLSARHDAIMSVLTDDDALVTTQAWHPATLQLDWGALQVTLCGQGNPYEIISRDPIRIDCAAPIQLEIVPKDDRSLDQSAWRVDQVGGWEVTCARGVETFRHPLNPGGSVTSSRSDWIFGVMETIQGIIRVTAPLPTEGIAPNARALRAFAAAGFAESGTPQEPDAVRRIANILSHQTSLAFIGPEGELPDQIPVMRKLALPEMLALEKTGVPPQQVALEPFDYGPPPAAPEQLLPRKVDDSIAPGARQPGARQRHHRLLPWLLGVIALLSIVGTFQLIDYPLPLRLVVILSVISFGAMAFLPNEKSPVRRRLPLLAVLLLPWIAALGTGPLLDNFTYGGAPPPEWMIPTQWAMLITSAILPLVLMPFMRGARRFTLALGILNLSLTFFVTISGFLILSPEL